MHFSNDILSYFRSNVLTVSMIVRRVPTFFSLVVATFLTSCQKIRGRATHIRSLALDGNYGRHESTATYLGSEPFRPKTYTGWNLSRLSSVDQLDAWRDRVAKALAVDEDERPVRVFVSFSEWMTSTVCSPSTLQPDGSYLINDCHVPCAVEFNKDQEQG